MTVEIFVAGITIAGLIMTLWWRYIDNRIRLKVSGKLSMTVPEQIDHLHLSCTNTGKQPVEILTLAFNPNIMMKKPARLMPNPIKKIPNISTALPYILPYTAKIDEYFTPDFFIDPTLKKFLGPYKWLARFKLKFLWRVVAVTNVGEFTGRLAGCLIEKIISSQYNN